MVQQWKRLDMMMLTVGKHPPTLVDLINRALKKVTKGWGDKNGLVQLTKKEYLKNVVAFCCFTCWHGPDPQCNFHLHRARPQKRCCLLLLLICWRAWSSMQFRSSWRELFNCFPSWNEKHLKYYKAKYFPQVSFCMYHIGKKRVSTFYKAGFFYLNRLWRNTRRQVDLGSCESASLE